MSSYANLKHRDTAIKCAKLYYHEKGGKQRKQLEYYFKQHPELDRATFFAEEEIDPCVRVEKLKAYHKSSKIKNVEIKINSKSI